MIIILKYWGSLQDTLTSSIVKVYTDPFCSFECPKGKNQIYVWWCHGMCYNTTLYEKKSGCGWNL